MQNIIFIGGGNMATSLIGGLLANNYPAEHIFVIDPNEEQQEKIQRTHGVSAFSELTFDCKDEDIIILAVKPQIMRNVCEQLTQKITQQPLFISIAAGIRSTDIDRWLGGSRAMIRCMPNTPSLLQLGATGLYANDQCLDAQKESAEKILNAVGITVWVDEEHQLDAVTALSGSGPAYIFLMIEAMQSAGQALGLDHQTAASLAKQTALGAAKMASSSHFEPAQLRENVTSKGGTTAAALASFADNDYNTLILNAMQAAQHRAEELAEQLGNDA